MKKVLIIDDDVLIRSTLSDLLETEGYDVDTAEDGFFGIQMMENYHYDVIITDMLMPERDGFEVIYSAREVTPDSIIITISGGGRVGKKGYLRDAKILGSHYTLSKPFDIQELLSILHSISDKTIIND